MKGEAMGMNVLSKWAAVLKLVRSGQGEGSVLGRLFAAYVGIALLLFALAAAVAAWQTYTSVSPKAAMKRMAESLSAPFFIDMIGLEATPLRRAGETTFSGGKVGQYVMETLLHINPNEPKSLLVSELPAMRGGDRTAAGAKSAAALPDIGMNGVKPESTVFTAMPPGQAAPPQQQPETTSHANVAQPNVPTANEAEPGGALPDSVPAKLTTEGRKVVFIYHSHPRESWVPELKVSHVNEAEDSQKNVTLIGKRLAEKLEEQGIGSVQSSTDYPTTVQGYNWNYSYKYSLQTVKEAFANNKDITYLFDIHRDSAAREVTTASIGGVDYAKVYFIVGKKNERWEQNEAFAKKIHDKLAADYPGISRGIWDKGSGGHAEYNQSVSPNSILIEVGGPYNTLEETYRTADALAKTIAALYWEAEKVNASVQANAPAAR